MSNTLIIIPTYNEKDNIEKIIIEIFSCAPQVDILVVDDNSPDGTGLIADKIASTDKRVSVLHRLSNRGRGMAGIDGFKEALNRKDILYVIEMDGDFSHNPEYIPIFLKEIENNDIVIGSRYADGGSDSDRGAFRVFFSKAVNWFIKIYLKLDIKDCTSGYRCFKRNALLSLDLDNMLSKGPAIVEEVLYKSKSKGLKIKEIPIVFKDRYFGSSKLNIMKLIGVLRDIIKFKYRSCVAFGIKRNGIV